MDNLKKKKILKILLIFFSILILATVVFLFYKKDGKTFDTHGKENNLLKPKEVIKTPSPFSGVNCSDSKARAFGIIVAQYPETMPLSGISEADIVIEWPPANAGGITRLLLIFQCQNPKEIGSIRSARPYISEIAKGFDLIFSSWGGPDVLYQKIKKIGLDWINAMENPSGAFFRKKNKPAPHNGFTSLERLKKAALDKKMRTENNFEGYQFLKENEVIYKKVDQTINISYSPSVKYVYDQQTGNYFRYWNNIEAVDQNTGAKTYGKNIVLLKTTIGVLKTGVADAKIIGKGEAKIYQGGEEIIGTWSKESAPSKLVFLNSAGEEIKFIPGPIWIEIVDRF